MARYQIEGDRILVDISERVATIALNRPRQYNALSRVLPADFTRALQDAPR